MLRIAGEHPSGPGVVDVSGAHVTALHKRQDGVETEQ
jgi:hypothetical protein